MTAPSIFISYSHKDEVWKDRLLPQLRALELAGRIVVWDDRKIDGGDTWYPEIQAAMEEAAVALCLISPDYLASRFCVKEEVPYLLQRRERERMALIPVLLRPCAWQAFKWLKEIQMLPRDGKSVAVDFRGIEDAPFAEVANLVLSIFEDPAYEPPAPPPPVWSPPEKVDTSRMPRTGAELFGRRAELEMLDEAWESESMNVVSLVAWGGVGKSTLVNKWLEQTEADNYRGARRVYAWSFYSQGTNERVTSADLFINNALEWFGDPEPTAGSPWDKGERLARLVRVEKTLLLLDGLEPLQSPHAHERGKIKDPALSTLLTELARENPGLCLITTRERVTDLDEFYETVLHKDLEQISDEAGRALLRVGGVRGTDAELEQATRDFGNHALAVQLLAVYLHEIPGHHVSHAADIPDLDIPVERGKHPRRMLAAFERRFGPGPELELLRMLGLFDRPADRLSLRALRRPPSIAGLTNHIRKLKGDNWLRLVDKLRRAKLIDPVSRHRFDDLDAHPLVREHFGEQLKQQFPNAWHEGNSRLYKHIKRTSKEFPDTIEEMTPLYAAVVHGCAAGHHQDVLDSVYLARVQRGDQYFSTRVLGAYGTDVAALAGFFDIPWRQPVATLAVSSQGYVLHEAGYDLIAVSQLEEATEALRQALEIRCSLEQWEPAANTASALRNAHLILGDLPQALNYSEEALNFAERSGVIAAQLRRKGELAIILHHMGQIAKAEALFHKAEEMQKIFQPEFPLLYSFGGFAYCRLLLDCCRFPEVINRAKQTLQWDTIFGAPFDIALDNLSLGRAFLLQTRKENSEDFVQALTYLQRAVDGLRQAGIADFLISGLLARAELRRVKGEFARARIDLDEVMSIATRGRMGLHQADCHLEYARLYLAEEPRDLGKARDHLVKAREMIKRMGYHLRDEAVKELEAELDGAGG
ncbi:MAG TPA: TIR domain-containing protein [Pyrinomonadaceae bacterium]|jgi:tetratricopeptide (TPR) repeat protein|nr:TIR domain-containing protein [Pyrinomonadaceae bacterium]